jgi:hypothetical protein
MRKKLLKNIEVATILPIQSKIDLATTTSLELVIILTNPPFYPNT